MKSYTHFLLPFIFLLSIQSGVVAQSGSLDPTFGDDGKINVIHPFATEECKDIAVDNDGRILVLLAGNNLVRFNVNGNLDTTFGNNGQLFIPNVGIYPAASAIEVDAFNRILVYAEDDYFYLVFVLRLLEDGSADQAFGEEGMVLTHIHNSSRSILLQNDGKILAGGQSEDSHATIQRLNDDGSADTAFNGTSQFTFGDLNDSYVFAMKQQSDGRLLITGTSSGDVFLARLETNGQLDLSFGNGGIVITDNGNTEAGHDVIEMDDGKIVVAGHTETEDSSSMLCWRFLSNGLPDNSFGANGVSTLYTGSENNFAWYVFPDSDSSIIVGGSLFNGNQYQPVLFHLLNDGTPDSNFGENGTAGKTFICGRSFTVSGAKMVDGKILLSGTAFENGNDFASVSQFFSNGISDTTFGENGTASYSGDYDESNLTNLSRDIIVLPSGKILCTAAGRYPIFFRLTDAGSIDSAYNDNGFYVPYRHYGTLKSIMASDANHVYVALNTYPISSIEEDLVYDWQYNIVLHRLNNDGTPDTTFAASGYLQLHFPGDEDAFCSGIIVQPDGKLLLAASSASNDSSFLIRINPDGSIDQSFGENGLVIFTSYTLMVTLRDDGKINCLAYDIISSSLFASRLLADGSPDPAFGNNVTIPVPSNFLYIYDGAFYLQEDNKMVVLFRSDGDPYVSVLKLSEDGSIDTTFDANGYLDLGLTLGVPAIKPQSDNKLIIVTGDFNNEIHVSRYLDDGTSDFDFGIDGVATVGGTGLEGANTFLMQLQEDGKILVVSKDIITNSILMFRMLNDITSGMAMNQPDFPVIVFPNPASDQLFLETKSLQNEEVAVIISNSIGQTIAQQSLKFNGNKVMISVKDIPPGFYIITLKSFDKRGTAKFVKSN